MTITSPPYSEFIYSRGLTVQWSHFKVHLKSHSSRISLYEEIRTTSESPENHSQGSCASVGVIFCYAKHGDPCSHCNAFDGDKGCEEKS